MVVFIYHSHVPTVCEVHHSTDHLISFKAISNEISTSDIHNKSPLKHDYSIYVKRVWFIQISGTFFFLETCLSRNQNYSVLFILKYVVCISSWDDCGVLMVNSSTHKNVI